MTTYYVQPYGDDTYDGGLLWPFRTIKRALSEVVAGDTVLVDGGNYHERIWFTKSGTTDNPIVIKAKNDDRPVIDGDDRLPNGEKTDLEVQHSPLFAITGDYVTFEGFEVRNSRGQGVAVTGHNCTIRDVISHHAMGPGIILKDVKGGLVEDCIVYETARSKPLYPKGGWPGSLVVRDSTNVKIRRTTVRNTYGEGCIILRSSHVLVDGCTMYDNGPASIYLDNASCTTVNGCLVYCTRSPGDPDFPPDAGISICDEDYDRMVPDADIRDNTIINNIVVGCKFNLLAYPDKDRPSFSLRSLTIAFNTFVNATEVNVSLGTGTNGHNYGSQFRNNLILQRGGGEIFYGSRIDTGIEFTNNLWWPTCGKSTNSATEEVRDPLLADPDAHRSPGLDPRKYALTGSSLRNKASPDLGIKKDFFGRFRSSCRPDMGAHEFQPTDYLSIRNTALTYLNKEAPLWLREDIFGNDDPRHRSTKEQIINILDGCNT